MSIAVPLPRESITESKYDSRSRSLYFSTSDRSTFTNGIIPSTHQKRTTERAYPASDLYSLGATCFHLLTTIAPWELWKKQGYGWINDWRQHLRQPLSEELAVYAVAISPNGQTLVSGSADKTIKIWNLQTGELKNTLNWHKYAVTSLAISPDGQTLVSGSFDNTIKIWNLQTGELKNTLTGHTDLVYAVAISPDGRTLVSGSKDNTIKMWRVP